MFFSETKLLKSLRNKNRMNFYSKAGLLALFFILLDSGSFLHPKQTKGFGRFQGFFIDTVAIVADGENDISMLPNEGTIHIGCSGMSGNIRK